ncbi:MAG: helix-turn-helix transcriptional regulator [Dehalococcoidia bacterium]
MAGSRGARGPKEGRGSPSGARAEDGPQFYTRLPTLRTDRAVSRRELAEAVGVHYQTIGYIERAEYCPSLDLVLRLARFFDVPVEAMFSLEPFAPLDAEALARRAG